MAQRLVVGLTGSFGSGKTTVNKMFQSFGAKKVISADQIVRDKFWPSKVRRKQIAREVFANPKKRKALEARIHPYVRRKMISAIKRTKRGVIVLEVPLLFEAKFDRPCDVTVTVVAGKANLTKRLARLGFNRKEINARLKAQLSEAKKIKKSDFIIPNKGSKKLLRKNAKFVWQKLRLQFKKEN